MLQITVVCLPQITEHRHRRIDIYPWNLLDCGGDGARSGVPLWIHERAILRGPVRALTSVRLKLSRGEMRSVVYLTVVIMAAVSACTSAGAADDDLRVLYAQ